MGRSNNRRSRRVNNNNARQNLPASTLIKVSPVKYNQIPSSYLSQFEDRRKWHPEGAYAPAKSFNRSKHTLIEIGTSKRTSGSRNRSSRYNISPTSFVSKIGFQYPKKVLICVRRKMRKQVLHALKKTGKKGQRRPKFNWYSKIRCK